MYDTGPFDPLPGAPPGAPTSRWLQFALGVPLVLFMLWLIGESSGLSHPVFTWVAVGSVAAVYGGLLALGILLLGAKLVRRRR